MSEKQHINVTIELDVAAIPTLPGTRAALERGAQTGGAKRNEAFVAPLMQWGTTGAADRAILVDPQTSGGLLVAVPADRVADYLSRVPAAVRVGIVAAGGTPAIVLR